MKKYYNIYVATATEKERAKRALYEIGLRAECSGCGSGFYIAVKCDPVERIKANRVLREVL